ncbi:hypothetical protein NPIL_111551, partial [Nephila pilipes]
KSVTLYGCVAYFRLFSNGNFVCCVYILLLEWSDVFGIIAHIGRRVRFDFGSHMSAVWLSRKIGTGRGNPSDKIAIKLPAEDIN